MELSVGCPHAVRNALVPEVRMDPWLPVRERVYLVNPGAWHLIRVVQFRTPVSPLIEW